MRLVPGLRLLSLVARRSLQVLVLLVGLAWIASRVEGADAVLSVGGLVALLAPVAAASGVALGLGELRSSGRWSAWSGLGVSPRAQLLPLVVLVLTGLLLQAYGLNGSTRGAEAIALPAPVSPGASSWPGLAPGQLDLLAAWQRPPGELSWSQLLERSSQQPPLGARTGTDRAELTRRLAWLLAWPLGVLLGMFCGLRVPAAAREGPGWSPLAASVIGGSTTVAWCLLVLVLSGALS